MLHFLKMLEQSLQTAAVWPCQTGSALISVSPLLRSNSVDSQAKDAGAQDSCKMTVARFLQATNSSGSLHVGQVKFLVTHSVPEEGAGELELFACLSSTQAVP